jgi:hypothetical protein
VVNPGFLLHWRARQGLAKSLQNYVLYVDTTQLTNIKTFVCSIKALQYLGVDAAVSLMDWNLCCVLSVVLCWS